jgi:sugar phosphate isomerase/epimerase
MVDIPMVQAVSAAARAGWPTCGIWFDPDVWTDAGEREIRRRVDDTGVVILDVEPIIVGPVPDVTDRLIDAAAALGARFVLFTSRVGDWSLVVERFGRACDLADAVDPNLTVVYEFLPAFPIATLADAYSVVREAERPNGKILIDNLHLRSSGGSPSDVSAYNLSLFPYVQIADAALAAPSGSDALLDEARNGRLWPEDGELPIDELLTQVPEVPISFEVRSAADRARFTDPFERAAYAWSRVQRFRATGGTGR